MGAVNYKPFTRQTWTQLTDSIPYITAELKPASEKQLGSDFEHVLTL